MLQDRLEKKRLAEKRTSPTIAEQAQCLTVLKGEGFWGLGFQVSRVGVGVGLQMFRF